MTAVPPQVPGRRRTDITAGGMTGVGLVASAGVSGFPADAITACGVKAMTADKAIRKLLRMDIPGMVLVFAA